MKKKLLISFVILLVVIFVISYLLSGLKLKRREKYLEYMNSILPDFNSSNITVLNGRENILKISQAIKTYYNACYDNNVEMVNEILNDEYVKYMDLDIEKVIIENLDKKIEIDLDIDTIYQVSDNMYFASVNGTNNKIYFVGIILNSDKTKYSIFLDGVYNYSDVKKYDITTQYDDHEHEDFENATNGGE